MSDRREPVKMLFVCSRNQWRSPTAESIWRGVSGVRVRSAGTSPKARKTVSASDIRWADLIFAMETKHRQRLQAQYARLLQHKPLYVLDIPDDYRYGDEELVELLRDSVEPLLDDWKA
ncbi:MAG: phosphotyrosine protein phosphatase [Cyanobacteria bacterium J06639_1]